MPTFPVHPSIPGKVKWFSFFSCALGNNFSNVHLFSWQRIKGGRRGRCCLTEDEAKPQVLLSDLIAVRKDLREERGMDWKEVCFRHDTQFQAASQCDGGLIDAVHLNSVIREWKPGLSASFVFFWCNKARFRVVGFFFPSMLVFLG